MEQNSFYERYQQLQHYARWSGEDEKRVSIIARLVEPCFPQLIDDFYEVLRQHPAAHRVITGGDAQIARLRTSLAGWLHELLHGPYDAAYVEHRSQVGRRHVAIGLDQVYTNAAISRLRSGMSSILREKWTGSSEAMMDAIGTLNKLLDLDLAIIEDAYEGEHVRRLREAERTRMEYALHQEKEFSEGLLEHAQAIVLVLDVRGAIVRYNPYMQQLTGVMQQDVQGKDWFDTFIPEPERERLREVFQETVKHADTSRTVSSIMTRAGRERRISWSNRTLKDVEGRTVAVLSVGQDITDLNEAQQRALRAERLAGIGQMSTGLAHESRNALQRIQACAEMLELEVEENSEAMDLVRRIKLAQDHMHRLFDEVRGYAASVNLDSSECNLGSIWREAWEILLPQWEGRIAELVEKTTDAQLAYCGDHFRLVQVFRILFENSLAACTDPVRIEVTCTPTVLSGTPALQISVRDNGPGLKQEQRERIFEPFYTTKTKGTGLGMAIAQRIVEAHHGKILVGNSTAQGAEIIVTLPYHAVE
jgi:PAS domain S-box-containing protein